MNNLVFELLLLKIQYMLSDNDRHRLHFLIGEEVPRPLRDDSSLSGTLRVLESLLDKAVITDEDCNYLIKAFSTIDCHDAAKRLQGWLSFIFFFLNMVYIQRPLLYVFQSINELEDKTTDIFSHFKMFLWKTMTRIRFVRPVRRNERLVFFNVQSQIIFFSNAT